MGKLVLTADQIYALAYIYKAKYLDYYYISLSDRGSDNALWLSENTKKLVLQGVLVEDFSGETTIDPETEALIKPLYFGTKESSLDIDIFGDNEDHIGYRFHFFDGKITMTIAAEEGFEISEVSFDDIQKVISEILPSDYSAVSSKTDIKPDAGQISRIIIVKNTDLGISSISSVFLDSDGVIYEEDSNDVMYTVSKEDFCKKIYRILAEV